MSVNIATSMTKKRDRSRVLIAFIISFAIFYVRIKTNGAGTIILEDTATHKTESTNNNYYHHSRPTSTYRKIESGWDDRGVALYNSTTATLPSLGYRNITFWHFQHRGQFFVSNNECNNRNFWEVASRGGWEYDTFAIFEKYVTPNETIVVDFGTWIGPTLLHHGSFSRRSFGIEADPVAFAVGSYNVELNRNKSWGGHVTIDSACVSRPEDVGTMEMKAGGDAGQSMSGIGDHVAKERRDAKKWFVNCYTLPDIFDNYWGIEKPYKDVFIKIDVESYECKLVPSFYDWLKWETYLPKMFITFHPQIQKCTDEETEGVLRFLRLYDHVKAGDKEEFLVHNATSVEDFHSKVNWQNGIILYQDHHAKRFPMDAITVLYQCDEECREKKRLANKEKQRVVL